MSPLMYCNTIDSISVFAPTLWIVNLYVSVYVVPVTESKTVSSISIGSSVFSELNVIADETTVSTPSIFMFVTFLFIIFNVTFASLFDPSISASKLYTYPSVPFVFVAVTCPFGFVLSATVIDFTDDFSIFSKDFSILPSASVISITNSFSTSGTPKASTCNFAFPTFDLAISCPLLSFNTICLVLSNIVISNFASKSSGFINLVYVITFSFSSGTKTSSLTLTLVSFLICTLYVISSPSAVSNVKITVWEVSVKSSPSITQSVITSVGSTIVYSFVSSIESTADRKSVV